MQERVNNIAKSLIQSATLVNGINLMTFTGTRLPEVVKNVAFAIRAQMPENAAFIAATTDVAGKPLLTVMLTDDIVARGLNASAIVREAAKAIKGGGGGQPGFAQAGGKDAENIHAAFDALVAAIK